MTFRNRHRMSLGPKAQPKPIFYDENKRHKQYNIRHGFNCHVNNVADDMVIDVDDMIADMAMMWKYW